MVRDSEVEVLDGLDEEWIILDSGSDVSLLPRKSKTDSGESKYALQDCQG